MGTHEHNEEKNKIYILKKIQNNYWIFINKLKNFIKFFINVDLAQVLQYICVNRKTSNKVFVGTNLAMK
jgi:hypothetical protein